MGKARDLVAKTTVKTIVKYALTALVTITACYGGREILRAEARFDALLQAHNDTLRVSKARDDSIQKINQAVVALKEQIVEKDAYIGVLDSYGLRLAGVNTTLKEELKEAIADSNFTDSERLDIATVLIATQDSANKVCEEKFNACQEKAFIFESVVDSLERSNGILLRDRDGFKSIADELRRAKECKLPLGIKCPSRGVFLLLGGLGGFALGRLSNGGGSETIIIQETPKHDDY